MLNAGKNNKHINMLDTKLKNEAEIFIKNKPKLPQRCAVSLAQARTRIKSTRNVHPH